MAQTGSYVVFLVLFLLAGLAFTVLSDPYIRRVQRRTLLLITGLCVSLILQNYVEDLLAAGPPRQLERTLAAIYGYCVRPVIIVLFYPLVAPKKRFAPAWILVGINAAVHMTALFSHVCFWISEDNHYQGGPLSNFCLLVSIVLMIWLVFMSVYEYRRIRKLESIMPVLIVAVIFAAIWLDGQVGYEDQPITYLTIAMSVSCVLYYIWLHLQFVREHEEDLKAQQRIRIMMSQIQPHFLYNTLSTIQVLCHTDSEKAADITGEFSAYLRQNLSSLNEQGLIPFWKELEHTKTYVKIEGTRFPHIRVEYDIRDSDFSLPPLTLQPIVENAIRHGVRLREEGLIEVATRLAEGFHELVIRDNGRGFDAASLDAAESSHIGLKNVRSRVESMCGGTLSVESRPDEGTTVTIRIPAAEHGREDMA